MDFVTIIAIAGGVASIVSLAVAWIQTARLRKLMHRKNADTWLALREVLTMVRGLQNSSLPKSLKRNAVVARAFTKAVSLHRQLLKQAILDEDNFSELTIKAWRRVGKLEEDWEENEARKFLTTETIKGQPVPWIEEWLTAYKLPADRPELQSWPWNRDTTEPRSPYGNYTKHHRGIPVHRKPSGFLADLIISL